MAAATTAARSFHDLYNAITLGMIESLGTCVQAGVQAAVLVVVTIRTFFYKPF